MGLSALIITKNEEDNIKDCLESVRWTDEIVVIDSFSDDATVEICKRYTEKVYQRQWENYSSQKNFGHTKCNHDWVLSLDADERVTPSLAEEIRQTIKSAKFSAFRICIRDFMFGKWIRHGSWPKQCHIRIYQRKNTRWVSEVHEWPVVEGAIGILSTPLLHFSHTSLSKFVNKMNLYTDIQAREWYQKGVRKNWAIIVLSSIRVFWIEYIWYQGFRDGGHGITLAILMAVYHFLARAKLWEMWYKHDHGPH